MTATLWVALAGTIATLLGTLLRLRHERKLAEKARADAVEDARQAAEESREKVKVEAESIAVAAANSAVKTVADALDVTQEEVRHLRETNADQARRLTGQDGRITELGRQVTDMRRRHDAAVEHIVDRERWTAQHLTPRPADLPTIPALLHGEVLEIAPDMAVIITPRERRDPPDEEDEETPPRARLPPE